MSVFISWSEKDSKSHKVALLLKDWLPKVLQKLKCFVSSHDIEAGANWMKTLFSQLEESHVGIICLTKQNLSKPWIFFEAGALAKKVDDARVCPLLIDIDVGDVQSPLGAFQLKSTTKDDMRSLLETINLTRVEPLSPAELDDAFSVRWSHFETEFRKISEAPDVIQKKEPPISPNEAIPEILTILRGIAAGRIIVHSELRGEASSKNFSDNAFLAADVLAALIAHVRERKPLLRVWVEECKKAKIVDDAFVMFYSEDSRFAFESLKSKPATYAFLEKTVRDISNLRLDMRLVC